CHLQISARNRIRERVAQDHQRQDSPPRIAKTRNPSLTRPTCTMENFRFGGEIVWRPGPDMIAQSNLQRFMRAHGMRSLPELQQRSTTDLDWFWNAVLTDLDIRFRKPYSPVLDLSRGIQWPQWCVGGMMNIVDNCLDKYAGTATDSKMAIRWEGEEGNTKSLSYSGLRRDVNRKIGRAHV